MWWLHPRWVPGWIQTSRPLRRHPIAPAQYSADTLLHLEEGEDLLLAAEITFLFYYRSSSESVLINWSSWISPFQIDMFISVLYVHDTSLSSWGIYILFAHRFCVCPMLEVSTRPLTGCDFPDIFLQRSHMGSLSHSLGVLQDAWQETLCDYWTETSDVVPRICWSHSPNCGGGGGEVTAPNYYQRNHFGLSSFTFHWETPSGRSYTLYV